MNVLTRSAKALPAQALSVCRLLLQRSIARRKLAIVAATFLVFAYAGGVLLYVMRTPDIGVRCAFTPVVNQFNSDFLFSTETRPSEPLRGDDEIVQIGDQPVSNWAQILHALTELRNQRGETGAPADLEPNSRKTHLIVEGQEIIRVRYRHAADNPKDEPHEVWLRVGRLPLETLIPSVLWFFLKLSLFAVGAIVFWKRPEDRSAGQFFVLCLVSFGAYMGGYHWSRIVTQPLLILAFMICSVLLPAVSLHFYLVFPRPKAILDRAPRRVLLLLYGPPLFFLLLFLHNYFLIRWLYNYQDGSDELVGLLLGKMLFAIYCYFVVAALWYLASVVCLLHSFRSAVGVTERNQVKWILWGTLASLAPIGYSLYLALLERQRFGSGAATWPMFLASLCVTVAFAISITRYRLMQLDQIINSGVIYFLISTVVGLAYYGICVVFTGLVLLDSRSLQGPSLGQVLAASSTMLLMLIGLNLIRGRLTAALNRHFRREKNQLDHTLQRMSQAIEQLVDPPTLAHRLLHTSAELLGANRGAIYLRQGDPPLYHLTEALGPAPALAELSSGCPLVETLLSQGALALPTQTPPTSAGPRQLHFLGGVIAQGLLHEGQLLGLLILGTPTEPRGLATEMSGGYTAEDLHLLTAFAHMTVLALLSAEGHRKIETLNRELQTKVEKIAEQQRRIMALQSQLSAIRHPPSPPDAQPTADSLPPTPESGMIGSSPQVRHLMAQVRKVATSDSVVLLRGESGTGKELLARALHENSPRAGRAFVAVHCSALSSGLLESELFGHVKGAFTNAIRDKVGRFEAADGGTLFLDEIGDISVEVQIKLLRVLQERTFERVGSSEPLKVDVRIVAATHQDLETLMRQGRFRQDLFYRLNVLPIVLPPLRQRAEDIPELALHFLRVYSQRMNKQVDGIDDDALARLKGHPWPGNIRQLENAIQHAVVVAEKPLVTVDELPADLHADPLPFTPLPYRSVADTDASFEDEESILDEQIREVADHWSPLLSAPLPSSGIVAPGLLSVIQNERTERERRERELLVRALAAAGGNKAEAARALGMARSTFISRLKRLGLT
jgi:transcriptional regulator with GAF, ATPase, and Fis domain